VVQRKTQSSGHRHLEAVQAGPHQRFDPSLKFLDMQLTSLRQDPEESFEDYYTRFGSLMETVFEEDDATQGWPSWLLSRGCKTRISEGS
jgi:hypothetical protein